MLAAASNIIYQVLWLRIVIAGGYDAFNDFCGYDKALISYAACS